ncbi:MAG: CrcB family protein [Actinobacteria bacterium]|nr:CrcB family protein [Actinomycetota bacterium]
MVAVALGGAVGTSVRYAAATAAPVAIGRFPWTTLALNVVGALLAGVAVGRVGRWAPLVVTGFLGGLTTMSALAVEADVLFRDGHHGLALAYVAASTAGGVAAALLGLRAGR